MSEVEDIRAQINQVEEYERQHERLKRREVIALEALETIERIWANPSMSEKPSQWIYDQRASCARKVREAKRDLQLLFEKQQSMPDVKELRSRLQESSNERLAKLDAFEAEVRALTPEQRLDLWERKDVLTESEEDILRAFVRMDKGITRNCEMEF